MSGGGSNLPQLNNPYQTSVTKNSAVGGNRVKSLPAGGGVIGAPGQQSYAPTFKYSGLGGGSVFGNEANYGGGGEQSLQGA